MRLQQLLTVISGYRSADVRRALAQALGKTRPRTPAAYEDLYVVVVAQLRLHAHPSGVPTELAHRGAALASPDALEGQSASTVLCALG